MIAEGMGNGPEMTRRWSSDDFACCDKGRIGDEARSGRIGRLVVILGREYGIQDKRAAAQNVNFARAEKDCGCGCEME